MLWEPVATIKEWFDLFLPQAGDTILIHAIKGGYTGIVRALLNRYADVDVEGDVSIKILYSVVLTFSPVGLDLL